MPDLIPQEHGGAINRFVKGESGNPNGRAKKWVSTLKEKGYKKSEIADAMEVLLAMDKAQLEEVVKDETNTILELTIAKSLLKGFEKGTLYNIETINTRLHGQPKQEIDQTITVTSFNISLNLNGDVPPPTDP